MTGLDPGTVDVWVLHIPTPYPVLDRAMTVLDAEEAARARRFVRAADRTRFVAAHVGLRRLLGAHLGVAPSEVVLSRAACPRCGGPHGRPQALGAQFHFSMAHSADVVLYAVAAVPVGVDVEAVEAVTVQDLLGILDSAERSAVDALPPPARARAILGCWVRKEAYLKGIGTGLAVDPAQVHVGCGTGPVDAPVATDGPDGWGLVDLPVGAEHVAALALAATPATAIAVSVGRFDLDDPCVEHPASGSPGG